MDTDAPTSQNRANLGVSKKNKVERLQDEIKDALSDGMDKLINVQENRKEDQSRYADSIDYTKVLAKNLSKLPSKDEMVIRHGIDRMVLAASMGDLSLGYKAAGIRQGRLL